MAAYPKSHLTIALLISVTLLFAMAAVPEGDSDETANMPVSLSIKPAPQVEPAGKPVTELAPKVRSLTEAAPIQATESTFKVKRGDSLATIFQREGLSPRELHDVISLSPKTKVLGKIKPGEKIHIATNAAGKLHELRYEVNRLRTLTVSRQGEQLVAGWTELEPEVLLSYETATITAKNPSVYEAGEAAGLSSNTIMNLSNIFQWDISFALDLRQGDQFTVLYEDVYVEGEKIRQGDILAAKFTNAGKTYTAILYEEDGNAGYFTPEGRSLRKAFLRDPVHFSHISSHFNPNRLHPIHKRAMPHRGIDYAARTGTPVMASGDGKVTIARQNNASGKFLVLQHGQQYTTKYLHLNGFARGIRAGSRVKQGQVIGYVGSTGWATGPHLHYEFLVNGVHRNPKTVKLPQANPIAPGRLPKFQSITGPVLAQLESAAGNRGLVLLGSGE